ncbi:MAG: HoxN/HupN/NixA family nickel/cobalt transporter [Nitrospiraceae bacterium]
MLDTHVLTIFSLGFLLGLRHALDADHIAAVSTILAQRPTVRAAGLIGLAWGLGHSLVLLVVGSAVLALQVAIPETVTATCEFAVGVMLVALGLSLAWKMYRERWHAHQHEHDGERHLHFHSHQLGDEHLHSHWLRNSLQPFLIGMAHGLAGSAALVLLVVSAVGSVAQGIVYLLVFGLGSIIGMILIGSLMSVPVVWSLSVGRRAYFALQGLASVGSIGLGIAMMMRIATGAPAF